MTLLQTIQLDLVDGLLGFLDESVTDEKIEVDHENVHVEFTPEQARAALLAIRHATERSPELGDHFRGSLLAMYRAMAAPVFFGE
jgi:hypothetical protein